MASIATITRTSDISGELATVTAEIALDGRRVKIDLTEEESIALLEMLEPYFKNGSTIRPPSRRGAGSARANSRPDIGLIRAWAQARGIVTSPRGRVAQSIKDAYDAAH